MADQPDPDVIRKVIANYMQRFTAQDRAGWLEQFAADAWIEDPVGTPRRHGHEEIGAFWDEEGRIISILDMDPCTEDPCPSYGPGDPFVGAVEVARGTFQRHGVALGEVRRRVPRERGHRAAKRGTDLLQDRRRRDRIAQVLGQERNGLPAHLQIRYIAI